jgi:hypothetical protein
MRAHLAKGEKFTMAYKKGEYKGTPLVVLAKDNETLNSERYRELFSFGDAKLTLLVNNLDDVLQHAIERGIAVPDKYKQALAANGVKLVKAS